ncbi:MAG TPA: hypothetical protein VN017_01545 [Pseudoxanthomonas sp.]|nr:hypothetical protein [Pseudoxanthomonas sp.]
MARPSIYTPEIVEEICTRLSKGEPLSEICRAEGMPDRSTVYDWIAANEDVSRRIARAREDGEEALAAECLQIADTPEIGWTEKYEKVQIDNPDDPEGPPVEEFQLTERKAGDMLDHRKLRIETRLKLLARWNPKKWGDRQTIEHDVVGNLADDLKAARERAGQR